jgi:aminopeptidase N
MENSKVTFGCHQLIQITVRNSTVFFLIILSILATGCGLYRSPNYPMVAAGYPKFSEKDSLLGYLNEDRSCFDVNFYELDLNIEPKKHFLSGSVTIYFTALRQMDQLQIDLDKRLTIASISDSKGIDLSFNRHHTAVVVKLKESLQVGEKHYIMVSYSGKPKVAKKPPWKGGLVWKKKKGKFFCGVACEDNGASVWWPCKDHISDKPDSIRASFSVPKGYTCVGNGRLTGKDLSDPKVDKFTWQTSYPINNYNVSFYLGDYRHFSIDYENDSSSLSQLDFYVRPENLEVAKSHFLQAVKILKVYEGLFGPYPWPKDGYKLVDSPYEGMEHQTAIAYGDEFKNGRYLNYDYIILHETAHEWWGNYVTSCDMGDLWIHEGFATYAEMLYEEKTEGNDAYTVSYLVNRIMTKNKRPVAGPKNVFYKNFRDNDIYNKGAVVLHMLRKNLESDELFFRIIYRFATEYHDACVTTEDFMQLVNAESGMSYDWFFEQYIYRREAPELLFYYVLTENNVTEFRYKWNAKNTNPNFKMNITVHINNKPYLLKPTSKTQILTLKADAGSTVSIDQDDYMIITKDKSLE